jgi:lipopolysaccharide/colanic/teichoic acid biosynthesis glycosyltransferase
MSRVSTLAMPVVFEEESLSLSGESLQMETVTEGVLAVPLPGGRLVLPATNDWMDTQEESLAWTLGKRIRFFYKKYSRLVRGTTGRWMKRFLDVCVALTSLILLSPLLFLVAALIKLTDGGPVLFWQTRLGRWGRPFAFPKFRSMIPNAEALVDTLLVHNDHKESVTFKMRSDPRKTWIGRIIRRLSIDELPQLWCVLKGDMTLVGPRPPVPREVALYSMADRRRLDVTPGLTCIWQVSGRGNLAFPQQVEMDVQYIESQSLWLDVKLLAKTIPAVVMGRGAY